MTVPTSLMYQEALSAGDCVARQLAQATTEMEASIAAFERERAQWQSSRSDDSQRKIDEQFLESVSDPELRQAFKKLLKSYSRRRGQG